MIAPLTLSRDARARAGLGVQVAASGFARIALGDQVALLPRVATLARLYRDGGFNDVSAEALLGLEWRRGADRWTPSLGGSRRWYGNHPYARTQTAALNWLHPVGTRTQWLLGASAARVRYQRNPLQDGGLFNGAATIERALSARTGVSATLSATRQTARDPGHATWSGGGSLLGWREWGRTTLFASGGLHRLQGDAALFLFPTGGASGWSTPPPARRCVGWPSKASRRWCASHPSAMRRRWVCTITAGSAAISASPARSEAMFARDDGLARRPGI